MTVGRKEADVAYQHNASEKKNTRPGHYEAVSQQPHWKELYTVPRRRQGKRKWRTPATARIQSAARGYLRRQRPCLRIPTADHARIRQVLVSLPIGHGQNSVARAIH